jgi:ribosome maturation factor RimP
MPHDALLDAIRDLVDRLGFELADLQRTGTRDRPILKVRIDRPDSAPGRGVSAEDCRLVSRALERMLEGTAGVGDRYVLEVSSPGIERPLRWVGHWRRFTGRRARVRAAGLTGRTVVEILDVPDEEHVRVRLPEGSERVIALADVRDAVLDIDWTTIGKVRRQPE